jgi:hypothetical protein
MMRKIIGAIAMATLVGSGLTGLPAAGAAAGGKVGTAPFTGTSTFDFPSGECATLPVSFNQVFDATITGHKDATLHIEGCIDLSNFLFTGTFTITWRQRHSVSGTAASSTPFTTTPGPCPSGIAGVLDMELTPVRAHGQPRPPIALDGLWCSSMTPGVAGPIFGTVTGALPPILH